MIRSIQEILRSQGHDENSPTIKHLKSALESLGGKDVDFTLVDSAYLRLLDEQVVVGSGYLTRPQKELENQRFLEIALDNLFQTLISGLKALTQKRLLGIFSYKTTTEFTDTVTTSNKMLTRVLKIYPNENLYANYSTYAELKYSNALGDMLSIHLNTTSNKSDRKLENLEGSFEMLGTNSVTKLLNKNFSVLRNFLVKYASALGTQGYGNIHPYRSFFEFTPKILTVTLTQLYNNNSNNGVAKQTLSYSPSHNRFLYDSNLGIVSPEHDFSLSISDFLDLLNNLLSLYGVDGYFRNDSSE